MGYRTYLNLDVSTEKVVEGEVFLKDVDDDVADKVITELCEGCADLASAINNDGSSCMETSWEDYDEPLLEFSKKYPDYVFTLSGVGDADDDRWCYFYKNGQMCGGPAEIVYPDYDPKQLSSEVPA